MSLFDAPLRFPDSLTTLDARLPVDGCNAYPSGDGAPHPLPSGAKFVELSFPSGSADGWFRIGGDTLGAAVAPGAAPVTDGSAPRDLPAGGKIVVDVTRATKIAVLNSGPYLLSWWVS